MVSRNMLYIRSEELYLERDIISSHESDGHKGSDTKRALYISGRDLEAAIYFLPQFPPNSLLFCSQSSKLSPLHIHLDLDADKAIDLLSRRLLHLWGLGD